MPNREIQNMLTDLGFGSKDTAKFAPEFVNEETEVLLSLTQAEAKQITRVWAVFCSLMIGDVNDASRFVLRMVQEDKGTLESLTDKLTDLQNEVF